MGDLQEVFKRKDPTLDRQAEDYLGKKIDSKSKKGGGKKAVDNDICWDFGGEDEVESKPTPIVK